MMKILKQWKKTILNKIVNKKKIKINKMNKMNIKKKKMTEMKNR